MNNKLDQIPDEFKKLSEDFSKKSYKIEVYIAHFFFS